MPGVAQEGAGVGEHANEVAQQPQLCQSGHLVDHALLGVVEPPAGAVLDRARDLGTLERAQEGAQLGIVRRVQGVEDGPGQFAALIQLAQQLGQGFAGVGNGNAVKAGVRAQLPEHFRIGVPQAGEVDLPCPAPLGIFLGAVEQQGGLVGVVLPGGQGLAGHALLEDGGQLLIGGLHIGNVYDAVVGGPAAVGVKVLDAFGQSLADPNHHYHFCLI